MAELKKTANFRYELSQALIISWSYFVFCTGTNSCIIFIEIGEMSERGKKRDEDEALSEGDEPPKKSSNPSAAAVDNDSDDSDHIIVCDVLLKEQCRILSMEKLSFGRRERGR
ncbi:RNA polymerase II transcriptional coactivator KIWI [Forsythia ovata]|uniref:RNA polymerase II transcriptional coactivator KIWI n=1 Tax=Forsythia ovata TaxID=205694 RepID=A0ABD1W9Q7_9LAMI